MKGILITVGVVIVMALAIIFGWVGVSNAEVRLKTRADAQQEVCATYFDKMWKILQQKAKVTDQYKESFKEIYTALIEGRYSDEGKGQESFMKWIQESNPQFSTALYADLMSSIEGERNGFFMEQQKLIDINREHENLRNTIPSSWVVGSRPALVIKIIKSAKTDEVYSTGQENDVDLFEGKDSAKKAGK